MPFDTVGTGTGSQRRHQGLGDLAKRAFDLTLALVLLPQVAVIIALLYLVLRLQGGPGFFGHLRIGRNGREFTCWKLRTMVPGAQDQLQAHLDACPKAAAQWDRNCKLDQDPRVTGIGRFLRASGLDELPQIWNVIRGEMSFVGPRPVPRAELDRYQGYEWCYFSVRPGITGLWQCSDRSKLDYDARVQLDVAYSKSWSVAGDIAIIFRTAGALTRRSGR